MKYVSSGEQVILGFPERLTEQRTRCTITEMRLHESGSMIAALVKTGAKNAHYIVVWVLAGYEEDDIKPFDPSCVEWRAMGCAFVGTVDTSGESIVSLSGGVKTVVQDAAKGQVCIQWLPTGALLVLKAQCAAASPAALVSSNGLVMLTLISPEVIYAGNLEVNWCDMNQVIESPLGRLVGVTAMPGVVVDDPLLDLHVQIPTVHVLLSGESRVMMVALTANKNPVPGQPQADLARVMWSDVRIHYNIHMYDY